MKEISLDLNAADNLRHKLALWKEEVKVHGPDGTGRSTLTQAKIDRLHVRVVRFYKRLDILNDEYRRIMSL